MKPTWIITFKSLLFCCLSLLKVQFCDEQAQETSSSSSKDKIQNQTQQDASRGEALSLLSQVWSSDAAKRVSSALSLSPSLFDLPTLVWFSCLVFGTCFATIEVSRGSGLAWLSSHQIQIVSGLLAALCPTVYDAQNRPLGTSNFVTLTNVTQITLFFKNPRNKFGFALAFERSLFCPEIPGLKILIYPKSGLRTLTFHIWKAWLSWQGPIR